MVRENAEPSYLIAKTNESGQAIEEIDAQQVYPFRLESFLKLQFVASSQTSLLRDRHKLQQISLHDPSTQIFCTWLKSSLRFLVREVY